MTFIQQLKAKGFNPKNEILSGLTVALALVPEAIAFSIIAQVSPLVGLYTAFIIGLVTSILGGRPGMISGATGAISVVVVGLVMVHGVEYLFAAVALMGLIQALIGLMKWGKLIRLVPRPVMFGFLNGLAIMILMSQFVHFKTVGEGGIAEWMSGTQLYLMIGLALASMAIIYFLPKVTKAIPSSLAAIFVISAVVIVGGLDTITVGDIASIGGGLPEFHLPMVPLNWETLTIIFPFSLVMAIVGLLESLLTLSVVDEMTDTRGSGNKECVAQGVANITTGFFGGMGGCAMIGQSIINVSSEGRFRLSGIVASVSLLMFILYGSSLIEQIPMAALVGLMFMVAAGTFEWASLRIFRKVPLVDVLVMVVVALVTVIYHNLALAVLVGVVISALTFAWENAKRIRARKRIDENGYKHYEIFGPLFFASTTAFAEKFDVHDDPEHVVIDFKESRIMDHSAIEAVHKITERYAKAGKKAHLRHLSEDSRRLMDKADAIIEVNHFEDPVYKVAVDKA
jgi:SulP family sulfate permease